MQKQNRNKKDQDKKIVKNYQEMAEFVFYQTPFQASVKDSGKDVFFLNLPE